jgi:hypothetical protein
MSPMSHDPFAAVPQGMRWRPHRNGYGSSLREESGRCTRCSGSGLVGVDHEQPVAARDGEPPARA